VAIRYVGLGTGAGTSATTSTGVTTSNGSAFQVNFCVDPGAGAVVSVTDTVGNVYTLERSRNVTTQGETLYVYTSKPGDAGYVGGGANHTVTVVMTSAAFLTVSLVEVEGVLATGSLDVSVPVYSSATPHQVTSGTLAQANEALVVACAANTGSGTHNYTVTAPFALVAANDDVANFWTHAVAGQIVSATTSQTASFPTPFSTTGGDAGLILVAYKLAAGGLGASLSSSSSVTANLSTGIPLNAALAAASTATANLTAPTVGPRVDQSRGAPFGAGSFGSLVRGRYSASSAALDASLTSASALTATLTTGISLTAAMAAVSTVSAALSGPRLGQHNLVYDLDGTGSSPKSLGSLATGTAGSTLIVGVGRGVLSDIATPTDNKGNTFTPLGVAHAYTNWASSGTRTYGCAVAAGGSGHIISSAKSASPTDEITLWAVEVLGGGVIQDHSWVEVLRPTALTSGNVTAARDALLVAAWWGDEGVGAPHTAAPSDAGWTVIDGVGTSGSMVQCYVAVKQVSAGTHNVTWTCSPVQGAQLSLTVVQAPDTGLQATLGASSSVTANLGTGIRLVASPQALATAAANLATSILLTASPAASSSLTAALSTGVSLTAVAAAVSTLAGELTVPKPLTASLQAASALTLSLATSILLSANLPSASALTGTLATGIPLASSLGGVSVVTAGLSTSIGLISTLASASSITASLSTQIPLVSAMAVAGLLTAALSVPKPLAASAAANAVLGATLSTGVQLVVALQAQSSITANLSAGSSLDATLLGAASVSASLSTAIRMSATGTGEVAASGNLSTAINLVAACSAQSSLSANLGTGVQLTSAMQGQSALTASLSTGSGLTVSSAASATLSGNLSTGIPLNSNISGQASLTATLDGQAAALAAILGCSAATTATLTTGVRFAASLQGSSEVSAALQTSVLLAATIAGGSSISANLSVGFTIDENTVIHSVVYRGKRVLTLTRLVVDTIK